MKIALIDGEIPLIELKNVKRGDLLCISGKSSLIYPKTISILDLTGKTPLILLLLVT